MSFGNKSLVSCQSLPEPEDTDLERAPHAPRATRPRNVCAGNSAARVSTCFTHGLHCTAAWQKQEPLSFSHRSYRIEHPKTGIGRWRLHRVFYTSETCDQIRSKPARHYRSKPIYEGAASTSSSGGSICFNEVCGTPCRQRLPTSSLTFQLARSFMMEMSVSLTHFPICLVEGGTKRCKTGTQEQHTPIPCAPRSPEPGLCGESVS